MQRKVIIGFVFAAGSFAFACNETPKPSPSASVPTTQIAAVEHKTFTASDCQKAELKSDSRCDWYFDPMREALPVDESAKIAGPQKK